MHELQTSVGGEGLTSSVSEPKSRRSNGIAATRSITNQPLKVSLVN